MLKLNRLEREKEINSIGIVKTVENIKRLLKSLSI